MTEQTQPSPRASVAVWAGMFIPYVALAFSRLGRSWFPVQDQAVLDMRVRDVLSRSDAPLVGAFSRFGWSHPGPVWFYVMAPFRLVGGSAGIVVGSVLVFGAGIATAVLIVYRRYGAPAAAVAAIALIPVVAGGGAVAVLLPWNPYLAFAWYPAFLVLCATSADRTPRDLLPALLLACLLVQLHVSFVVLAAVPLTAAAAMACVAARPELRALLRRAGRRPATWVWVGVAALVWAPPAIDLVANGSDSNAARLVRFFVNGPSEAPTGAGFAVRTLAGVLRFPLPGLGGTDERLETFTFFIIPGSPWPILIVVAALGIGAVVALKRRDRRGVRVMVVAGVAVGAGLIALSRVVGERWTYLFIWRFAVVWFALAVSALVVVRTSHVARRALAARRSTQYTALGAIILIAGVFTLAMTWGYPMEHFHERENDAEALARKVERSGMPDGPVVMVRFGDSIAGVGDGVLNRLDDLGWPIKTPPDAEYKYGSHRGLSPSEADQTWLVSEAGFATTVAISLPNADIVAYTTPLSPTDDAELVSLQLKLIKLLRAQGRPDLVPAVQSDLVRIALDRAGVDTGEVDMIRLQRLNAAVTNSNQCRCAIVAVPAGTPASVDEAVTRLDAS